MVPCATPEGQAMVLEDMDSSEGGVRTVTPGCANLEKLGITLISSVDFAAVPAAAAEVRL